MNYSTFVNNTDFARVRRLSYICIHTDLNRAVGKPAFQSSTLERDGFMWNASLGVDGDFNQYNASETRTCSSTMSSDSPWWYLDMEGIARIDYILVYGQAGDVLIINM